MQREPVKSTVVAAIGYSPISEELEVEFHSGRVYRYFHVPEDEYEALMSADSIGSYFNRRIRTEYDAAEVRGEK
jgi:KTSC domain